MGSGFEAAPRLERGRHFLHEERHAMSAVVERRAKPRPGLRAENPRCDTSGCLRIERLHAQLGEPACSTEVGPQPSQRMAAGNLVTAVRAEHEERPCSAASASDGSSSRVAASAH